MTKPLEGIRIVEFGHVFAGPFATFYLGLLGADVIKIEATGRGDAMRYYGNDRTYHGMAPHFVAANTGKRAISLDLKSAEGKTIAEKLIASADVVIENYRPGSMRRLGLGYEDAKKLRSDIIYCSVSGYGQTGAKRDNAAIDNIVQATSGMMDLNGGGDMPHLTTYTVVDSYTATMAAMSVLTAVLQRQKDGKSQFIDVAMLDSAVTLMASAVGPYLVTGQMPTVSKGRGISNSPGTGLFQTKDGKFVSLGIVQDGQFAGFCKAVGREDLLQNPEYNSTVGRSEHRDVLVPEFVKEVSSRTAAELDKLLNDARLPAGIVRQLDEVVDDPDVRERGLIKPITVPGLPNNENVAVVGLGFQFEHDGPEPSRPAPWCGEHTFEIMQELGYSSEQCAQMRNDGVVEQYGDKSA
ncbi:CaiB/BaiF CoA transferase family protein [Alteromonas lipolytica]|uniref:Carnitine dehydratase n=1 Tax=Alteromonas lipolytica TaxID=1856405 RepID=A0A1E8FC45_9ALTE|nr:CoA transferase [Alteromonas lipolytica]OFI33497.1 hypothetical protein BFC17_04355 [Alteromonas lipolytica]GGF59130.1 CoA transferase [Alteromonas lipolytica]